MRARPARPSAILAVAVGGLLGTPARYGVSELLPDRGGWPLATLLVNVVGAFALGLLLESLTGGGRERLRLCAGTGFFGSFTTYSALAVESDLLVRADRPLLAAGYALTSVALGLVAAGAGVAVGARAGRTREVSG